MGWGFFHIFFHLKFYYYKNIVFFIQFIQTYSIQDFIDIQELTSNVKESRWDIPSAVRNSTFGYNSNGWKYGNASSYSRMYYVNTFNAPISVEFQVNEISSNALLVEVQDENKENGVYIQYNSYTSLWNGSITNVTQTLNTGSIVRVEFHSDKIEVYVDDTLITSGTITLPNTLYLALHCGNNRYIRIKNLKIKPL